MSSRTPTHGASHEPDVGALIGVPDAIRIIDSVEVRPRVERRRLSEADGLRLAAPLASDRDYPPFDKSQMDGYAVRAADVAQTPAELHVVGEVAAGGSTEHVLGPGEAIAIMTGAPLPGGADDVVPVEDVEKLPPDRVRVLRGGYAGRFIAPRGSDCRAGTLTVPAGTRLGPVQIAVAASFGAAELDVFAPPEVAVLATGDELAALEETPGPSQIRNSNSPMLVSLLKRMGCKVTDLGTARDEPGLLREALARGLEHDALFVTGGMSMGAYDYVPRLLEELGVSLRITKLRIKPGKPFVFGVHERGGTGRFVFGLPGNPVSAMVCTVRLASRLLTRLAGGAVEERWLSGRLDAGLPANGPREFYQPAIRNVPVGRVSSHTEFATITPLAWKGSADIFTLARANVLLVRPENDPALPRGTVLRALEF